ncbi:hypothetical protein GGX14DRAFT_518349 [Mycena pura]|uniref:Integrase core domain-containing protein n=1 Tax=Mycena pura TaxID=153505 RepID=A0AAD6YEW1_9AGAR|nr:hypothetical protein GGX14DRAFT_518349 [Mycena pura]
MDDLYGPEHGTYIWGRSVHNIRIERLWCDVTRGFGRKWYNFFLSLEFGAGLKPDLDAHIWLLHRLFLPALNEDALEWARAWNEHKLRLDDERTRSPRDMFFFGMIENGLRGFEDFPVAADDDEDVDELDTYGVDWDDLQDPTIIAHHAQHNVDEELTPDDLHNPFSNDGPHKLSHVEVAEPLCPFTPEQVDLVDAHIAQYPHTRNMNQRQGLWIDALDFCRQLYEE